MLFTKTVHLVSGLLALALIATAEGPSAWGSPARLHHKVIKHTAGVLRVDSRGIAFVPSKGSGERWNWTFIEIKDLDLGRHRLILTEYNNRPWHLPGTRQFNFDLKKEMTPAVAASLAEGLGRPVRNRIPDPKAPAITVTGARRNEHFGGSNGVLRIRRQGIDYVSTQPDQSRSWRWTDLQTISDPEPYQLFVFGYLDAYAFDLKQPLSRDMLNHLSDEIWAQHEREIRGGSAAPVPAAPPDSRWRGGDE